MKTLYIFIDESGNFDFSSSGTKYFILTALSSITPFGVGCPLLNLRYALLPEYRCGMNMEKNGYFHASEDIQSVRDKVFSILSSGEGVRVDSVIAQKNKANPCFYKQPVELYKRMGEALLKYTFKMAEWHGYEHVVVVFSSIFDNYKRGILKQAFKSLIKQMAKTNYALYFHDSKFDLCNQAVDYYGWAIFRKWEREDLRSYAQVRKLVNTEFAIFNRGTKEFYSYKNDLLD